MDVGRELSAQTEAEMELYEGCTVGVEMVGPFVGAAMYDDAEGIQARFAGRGGGREVLKILYCIELSLNDVL